MEKNVAAYIRYSEKEDKLFSQSFIGYWITKSPISVLCRLIAVGLMIISTFTSFIAVNTGYHSNIFLYFHFFVIIYSMVVFGLYLPVVLFLTIKHTKALCSNSPVTLWSCINYTIRLCTRAAGAVALGFEIIPIDWTCEKVGLKPIFLWAYYPGLRRLTGEITSQLAAQSSKELGYVNPKIPGSQYIHYLQDKTDAAEAELAAAYKIQQENKLNK